MIANSIMIILGWLVLLGAASYMGITTLSILRTSLAFGARLGGEFVFFLIVFAIFAVGVWYFFPFEVAMKIAPVGVK